MQEMQEMCIQSLGPDDPLEKEMATFSSILAWEIHIGTWYAQSMESPQIWVPSQLKTHMI